jgi:hypothetical protein
MKRIAFVGGLAGVVVGLIMCSVASWLGGADHSRFLSSFYGLVHIPAAGVTYAIRLVVGHADEGSTFAIYRISIVIQWVASGALIGACIGFIKRSG